MPSELFSFTSLPSVHYSIELSALSFSSAGHLTVWPPPAANEGIDYCAGEIVAGGAIPALGVSSRAAAVGRRKW